MEKLLSNMVDRADEAVTAIKDVVRAVLKLKNGLILAVEHVYSLELPSEVAKISKVKQGYIDGCVSYSKVFHYIVTNLANDTLVFFRTGGSHLAEAEHGSEWNLIVNSNDNWREAFSAIRDEAIEVRQRVVDEYKEILKENGVSGFPEPEMRERFKRHYVSKMVVETSASKIGEGRHVVYKKRFVDSINIATEKYYQDNKSRIDTENRTGY